MRNFTDDPATLTEQIGILQYLKDLLSAQGLIEDVRPALIQSILNIWIQQPAVGQSIGFGAADGVMEYFYAGDGQVIGIGTATAIAEYIFFADGLSVGTTSVNAQVEYTAFLIGESIGGTDYIAGIGETGILAVGTSDTLFDVLGISATSSNSVGLSEATSIVAAVGKTDILGIGASSDIATVFGISNVTIGVVGSSIGTSSVTGSTVPESESNGLATGTSTISGVGLIAGAYYRNSVALTPYQSRSNSSFTKPTGTVAGDTLVMCVFVAGPVSDNSLPTITAPSGFSNLGAQPVTTTDSFGTFGGIYAFYKIAGGSEPSSYATTHIDAPTEGILYCIGGGYGGMPDFVGNNGTGTVIAVGPLTIANARAFVIEAAAGWDDGSADPPTGYTERYDPASPTNVFYAADMAYTATGSTGSITNTLSGNESFSPWQAILINVESGEYVGAGSSTGIATVAGVGQAV